MPSKSIPFEPNQLYHIWTHANGNENLFREDKNYRFFLSKYSYHIAPVADTFAYCLMPNHLHLMLRIKGEEEVWEHLREKRPNINSNLQGFGNLGGSNLNFSPFISKQFSNLFNSYTKAYNKLYNRMGSLFIPNFKRKPVTSESYYLRLMAYIHLNPVHHGFVDRPEDWLHSSWHAYLQEKRTRINKDEVLEWAGGRDVFFKMHQDIHFEKFQSIFEE